MTYFELISVIDSLIDKAELTDNDITQFNSFDIKLEGSRYYRFIAQLNHLMSERLNNLKEHTYEVLVASGTDTNNLILALSPFRGEANCLLKLANISLLDEENKSEYVRSIRNNVNMIMDEFMEIFTDDETQNIIKGFYLLEG